MLLLVAEVLTRATLLCFLSHSSLSLFILTPSTLNELLLADDLFLLHVRSPQPALRC
jgi:hypothetical protein